MQIIVLGMHRSGTSALARILNLMGVYFGTEKTSTGASPENEKGFWERMDVRNLNDSMLHNANSDWDRISGFDADAIAEDLLGTYRRAAGEIVLNLDAHRPWFIKEPRLCLLLPVWKQVLEIPFCVHIFRNPLEVAASLEERNAIPLDAGMALWEAYNAMGIAASSSMPRLFLSYSALMSSPATEVERLKDALISFGGYALRSPTEAELGSFLDDRLYHHRRSEESTQAKATTSQWDLHEAMQEATRTGKIDTPPVSRKCKGVLRRFEESGDHLAARIRRSNARQRASLTEADSQLALKSLQLDHALTAVKDKSAAVANAGKKIAELTEDRNKLRTDGALKRQEIQRLTNDLNEIRKQRQSIRNEFKSLEANAAREAGELTAHLEAKSTALADAEGRVEQLSQTAQDLAAELDTKSNELESAKAAAAREAGELTAHLEAKSTALADAEGRVEQLSQTAQDLAAELDTKSNELESAKAAAARETAEIGTRLEETSIALADAEGRVEQLSQTAQDLAAELDTKSNELESAKAAAARETAEIGTRLEETSIALADAEGRVEQLSQTAQDLAAELDTKSNELESAKAAAARETAEIGTRLEETSIALADAEGRVEQLSQTAQDLAAELDTKSNELESAKAAAARETAEIGTRLEETSIALADAEGRVERLTDDLRDLKANLESRNNEIDSIETTAKRAIEQTTRENERLLRDIRALRSQFGAEKNDLAAELQDRSKALQRHEALIDNLVTDIEAVFLSRRWRLGHFLGSLQYWLLFKNAPHTAREHIAKLIEKHRQTP